MQQAALIAETLLSTNTPVQLAAHALFAVIHSGTLIRLFSITHDMLHDSFFSRRTWNRAGALLTGTLCNTSPSVWKREHDFHHAHSNDLDFRQDGQTASWSLRQFQEAPRWQRLAYRVVNHPIILLTVVPIFYFFGFMRIRARWHENLMAALFLAGLWATGLLPFFIGTSIAAASLGFLVFHAQHTFPGVYKSRGQDWDYFDNAMQGASFLRFPTTLALDRSLTFFFAGIEYHHAHHLHPKIPGYRLAECHRAAGPLFDRCPRVTLTQALRTLRLSLYDEDRGRLVES